MNLFQSQKFKSLFFVSYFLLFFTFLSAQDSYLSKDEQLWIKNNPTVTLGADYKWAPFDYADSNAKHAGIASDF